LQRVNVTEVAELHLEVSNCLANFNKRYLASNLIFKAQFDFGDFIVNRVA
jgi:hypothetical protein